MGRASIKKLNPKQSANSPINILINNKVDDDSQNIASLTSKICKTNEENVNNKLLRTAKNITNLLDLRVVFELLIQPSISSSISTLI